MCIAFDAREYITDNFLNMKNSKITMLSFIRCLIVNYPKKMIVMTAHHKLRVRCETELARLRTSTASD